MPTQQLIVAPVEIIQPLVLASPGFLATLETVEQQIASLTITDAVTAQQAADLQKRLTTAAKTLNDQRLELNRPFEDQIKAINTAAKGPALRIESAKSTVSRALTAFAVAEQQRVLEENRKRQAELAALQEQQRREQADRDKLAAEPINATSGEEDWGDPAPVVPTETERKIAAVAVPVVAAARPSGVTIRTTLQATVEDISKVPEMFIERSVKLRAIQSTYCSRWKEGDPMPVCGGVKFTIDKQTVSTGR